MNKLRKKLRRNKVIESRDDFLLVTTTDKMLPNFMKKIMMKNIYGAFGEKESHFWGRHAPTIE